MPDVHIINPTSFENWDDLILSTEENSFFFTTAWANVLKEAYGYVPVYFTIIRNNRLIGFVPLMEIKSMLTGRRGVSLPFTDYCEPIINNGYQHDLFNVILDYGKKSEWRYIEYRGGERLLPGVLNSALYYRHILHLSQSHEKLISKFRNSTKRNIQKASKEDVHIKISNSFDSLMKFYQIHCVTRKFHGVPPQPVYFFKTIYNHVISANHGIVVLGFYHDKVIAGAVFFHFDKKAVYKYGASDRAYQKFRINNLIMWEAIKWYSERGYEILCLGRTEPENKGLLQFKNGWGTQLVKVQYYKYNLEKNAFETQRPKLFEISKKLFKKMPIPVLKKIGSLLYRHVG